MVDKRYREELDRLRFTDSDKRTLARALAGRAERRAPAAPGRRWSRTVAIAAALACILCLSVGAVVVSLPVVRNYFGNSAGYQQSAILLGESMTQNGWTMTLTDCAADDYTIYLGVTLTAPEGTVLDWADGYYFADWSSPTFPELNYGGAGTYTQIADGEAADNQVSFVFQSYYLPEEERLCGQEMEITLGKLYHNAGWNGGETYSYEKIYDCTETWHFRTTLNYPDHVIHLTPNLAVRTLDADAVITDVVISPLTVYVSIEGDGLKGHHDWVPKTASGDPACIENQEIILYTKDGTSIPLMGGMSGSGCSGGDLDHQEGCWLHLVRRPDAPLDMGDLASISICGVEIPLV